MSGSGTVTAHTGAGIKNTESVKSAEAKVRVQEQVAGRTSTNPSAQINGNSYDINKLQKTQPYTYPEIVSSAKETIAQNAPNFGSTN